MKENSNILNGSFKEGLISPLPYINPILKIQLTQKRTVKNECIKIIKGVTHPLSKNLLNM